MGCGGVGAPHLLQQPTAVSGSLAKAGRGRGLAVVPEDEGGRALNLLGAWWAGFGAGGDGDVSLEMWPQH